MEILKWDWRQQLDIQALALIVLDMSGGTVHITPIDTGSDKCAIVISGKPLSALDAFKAYRQREEAS